MAIEIDYAKSVRKKFISTDQKHIGTRGIYNVNRFPDYSNIQTSCLVSLNFKLKRPPVKIKINLNQYIPWYHYINMICG